MASRGLEHTLWAAFSIGVVHLVSGVLLISTPAVLNVTPLAELKGLVAPFAWLAAPSTLAGVFLIVCGALALTATSPRLRLSPLVRLLLTTPQQVALLCQLISITIAIHAGAYPDGYEPDGGASFIAGDQLWALSASLAHTIEGARLSMAALSRRSS